MKRLLAVMLLIAISGLSLSWVSAAQTTETADMPPYREWKGSFVVAPDVPFVWLRLLPASDGTIVGTLPPNTRLTAKTVNNIGLVFDPIHSQWWGTVTDGRIEGWLEVKFMREYVPPTPAPTSTPAPTTQPPAVTPAPWPLSSQVRVRAGLSFVWLRATGNSNAIIMGTYFPGRTFSVMGGPVNDGVQYWWQVRDVSTGQPGWLEQNSLESVSASTGTLSPDRWKVSDVVRVRRQVPFVWLRPSPASGAGILATVRSPGQLWLSEARQFDGVQYWWRVQIPGSTVVGWVEEQSLEFVRSGS